ncbi:MAG: Smr/MutS family protein, partial [Parvularculaceae bacterium]|nr:Smr/MutS family protein [Parvularculaceae bacterium]
DLHGLTQERAHVRLLGFLETAQADGVKCVRVITGKGGDGAAARGILRRRFLDWIEAAPFRPLVVRVAPAETRLVAGAYYVFVKRRR